MSVVFPHHCSFLPTARSNTTWSKVLKVQRAELLNTHRNSARLTWDIKLWNKCFFYCNTDWYMNFLKTCYKTSLWTRCTVRRSFRTFTKSCVAFGHINTMNRARTAWKSLTSTCSCCWPAYSLVTASPMLLDAVQSEKRTPVAQRGDSLTGWLASNWHGYDCSFVSQKYRLCRHLEGHRVKSLSGGRVRTCHYENYVLFVRYAGERNEYQVGHALRFRPLKKQDVVCWVMSVYCWRVNRNIWEINATKNLERVVVCSWFLVPTQYWSNKSWKCKFS